MVNSRQEAEDAVAAMLYPPRGNRSVGGSVHALNFNATAADYYAKANDELLVVIQCEHIQAVENATRFSPVPGIDAIFVGPNDLAASMRSKDGKPPAPKRPTRPTSTSWPSAEARRRARLSLQNADEAVHRMAEGWHFWPSAAS